MLETNKLCSALDASLCRVFRHKALVLVAAFLTSAVSCSKSVSNERASQDEARPVKVTQATVRPWERTVQVSGSLAAHEQATLSVKVPGRLELISVDIGSVVRKGDVLARLERKDYELQVRQAAAAFAQARAAVGLPLAGDEEAVEPEFIATVKQAQAVLAEAKNNRERVQKLSQDGISSKSEVDTVETAYVVAFNRYQVALEDGRMKLGVLAQRSADLDVAKQQLADTEIRAPFDGAVQTRSANTGEYLPIGTPVVAVVRIDPLRLRLEIPERHSLLVQTGQLVRLAVEGSTNTYLGHIARVSPAIAEQNRMLLVEADVPNQGVLRPGLFVRARIVIHEEPAVTVPSEALITFAGIEKVIAVEDGKVRERTVTTGRRTNGWIEITRGLNAGDSVVLAPGNLRTGQTVKVVPVDNAPLADAAGSDGP
jgi:RND family efflux transporter MFP subunit